MGLAAGVGATMMLGPRLALTIEARYEHGFFSLDPEDEFEIENRAIFFTLGAGYRFDAAPAQRAP